MRILLLGANGQVGFELLRSLAPLGEVEATTRSGRLPGVGACHSLDMADLDALKRLLERRAPDVVVNAAAYTAVDRAEDEPQNAFRINAEAVAALAQASAELGALLVHYSTDYVFPGTGSRPWKESDPTEPLGVYGSSKRAGEVAIQASGCNHLILRTAWVYAARGGNFLRTMLRLAEQRDQLSVVADQRGAPTPARWIAAATAAVLAKIKPAQTRAELLHLSAAGECSWYDFAEAIFETAVAAGLLNSRPSVQPIASADYPTRAKRPAYSRLDTDGLQVGYGVRLPDWQVGVQQVIGEMTGV